MFADWRQGTLARLVAFVRYEKTVSPIGVYYASNSCQCRKQRPMVSRHWGYVLLLATLLIIFQQVVIDSAIRMCDSPLLSAALRGGARICKR